jgi:hypothetical protein
MCRKDKQAASETFLAGKRVALRDVDFMLADRMNEVRGRSDITAEDEHKGRLLLSRHKDAMKEKRGNVGWGVIASGIEKYARKLDGVGRLAEDEE